MRQARSAWAGRRGRRLSQPRGQRGRGVISVCPRTPFRHMLLAAVAALLVWGCTRPEASSEAASPWIEQLRHEDMAARLEAMEALGRMGPKAHDAVSGLANMLLDENARVGDTAYDALCNIDPGHQVMVPRLVRAMKDPNWQVRRRAIGILGRLGPRARVAAPLLVKALRDDSLDVRETAAYALKYVGPAAKAELPALSEMLKRGHSLDQLRTARAILGIDPGNEAALQALIELAGISTDVGGTAGAELASVGPAVVPKLIQLLAKEAGPRPAGSDIINALAAIGPEAASATPVLIDIVTSQAADRDVISFQELAVHALGCIGTGDAKVESALKELLTSNDPGLRLWSAAALARIGCASDAALPVLIDGLRTRQLSEPLGLEVTRAMGFLGPAARPATPLLVAMLQGGFADWRAAAATSLGKIDPDPKIAVPGLQKTLRDSNWQVAQAGAVALAKIGPDAAPAIPELRDALRNDCWNIRKAAVVALGQIGPASKEAVPELAYALKDMVWSVREAAAIALGKIGPGARSAVPALQEARQDWSEAVRGAASQALKEIRSEGKKQAGLRGTH